MESSDTGPQPAPDPTIPTNIEYLRQFAIDGAYITPQQNNETSKAFKRRIYDTMVTLLRKTPELPIMGISRPKHAHRRPPTATHWFHTRISSALRRRKWQLFGFDCDGWRNLGVPLHTWDQTTITWVAAFLLAQAAKIQNTVCRQSHGTPVPEGIKMDWYRAIHDIVPTKSPIKQNQHGRDEPVSTL